MSCLTINIIPDSDTIHTFSDDGTTLPNESYTISGTVEISATRPIQIRQLSVQFKGIVDCVISTADFFEEPSSSNKCGDEIPLHRWNTIDPSELGFVDRMTRKALGQANASLTASNERIDIFSEPQVLGVGKTCWPFTLKINNVHLLPPSLFSPHHTIQYHLSARIRLNSLSERVKVSYWNARLNTLRLRRVSTSSSEESSSVLSAPAPPLVVQPPHIISEYNHHDQETNDFVSISSSNTVVSKRNKRQLLGCSNPIQIYRHAYPSMYSLYSVPRIRYRGSRKDHISYEIGMSKFTCLQKKNFPFTCSFKKICQDAVIESLEYYLEQTECYPIKAGDFNTIANIFPDLLVPRHRKFSRTKHDMQNYQDGQDMKLDLNLDLPHISPHINTDILQISHKLRLIIKFKDSSKERNMSLSFPLTVGTVPKLRSSIDNEDQPRMSVYDVHVRQELDQWLLTPDEQYNTPFFDDCSKLPSYRDALREGNPPSPFLEDNF